MNFKKAKRVYKGIIFEVYQWSQKMFDGSRQTYEWLKRPPTVEIIGVTKNKKIMVLEQRQPHTKIFFSMPGGKVDKSENLKQAALRELREETGYAAKKLKLWKSFEEYTTMDWTINMFIARDCRKAGALAPDPGEKIKVRYFSFEQFLKLVEKDNFWCSRYFSKHLYKCLMHPKAKKEFYQELFG
ncbi:MAG TPA: NUDIX hydrolase [Patescibacteria group bacterium]|nr:NUDIX hydrolase [Patescibacteria group bacterium]